MSKPDQLPIVLIGGGGHASVLSDILLKQGRDIIAVVSPDNVKQRAILSEIKQLQKDEDILQYTADSVRLVNGIGMLPKSGLKRKLNEHFLSLGYQFETVISDDANVSPYATIGQGAQVFHGTIIQAGVSVGAHSIINSGALIEHDCQVGEYNHIAPRATLCGQVVTESEVYVGAGAMVIQNLQLGESSIVGAGVTLTESLLQKTIAYTRKVSIKSI